MKLALFYFRRRIRVMVCGLTGHLQHPLTVYTDTYVTCVKPGQRVRCKWHCSHCGHTGLGIITARQAIYFTTNKFK
jgi:hypothetical protein